MPVWAVWTGDALYFSTARTSTKARNFFANPNCSISTEHGNEAVILEGSVVHEEDHVVLKPVWDAYKAKYDWGLEGESMFALRPKGGVRVHRDCGAVRLRRHPLALRLAPPSYSVA